jgi:protein-glucosylgalactosylhydroxylysine glucosidase
LAKTKGAMEVTGPASCETTPAMMKKYYFIICCLISVHASAQKIDREAVVRRHTIHINKADSLGSLTVGNGNFAMTVDITGLQSFPEYYKGGVPLGTQSVWGWNSIPNDSNYRFGETLKTYELAGRKIPYPVQWKEPERNKNAADFFRQQPHRIHLGNVGLEIIKKNGQLAGISDIENIDQQLDMWTGEIRSRFTVEGEPVEVITYAHQEKEAIGVKINSPLVALQKIQVRLRFPFPTGEWKDVGANFTHEEKHRSNLGSIYNDHVVAGHLAGSLEYWVKAEWTSRPKIYQRSAHEYIFAAAGTGNSMELVFWFTKDPHYTFGSFVGVQKNSLSEWKKFWNSGGAIDLSGSTDQRAFELERRMVLSQYLTKVNCSGAFPPQETGLTYNSWFGKPHLEMHWWHAVHFALWGRSELMQKSLDWYFTVADSARAVAKRQGFEGLRWQKMVDHQGTEAPSSVGSFLVWQQPHFIYMAELLYREKRDKAILNKYKELLFATADFMASYPSYDAHKKKYNLGPGLIPAQECFDAVTTFNPTYELAYWHWGLSVAQQWRERLGLPREKKWDEVINNLAPLPKSNGVYLATESTPDCYTTERYLTDHPAVLGAYASIPASHGLDKTIMKNTFDTVWKLWKWNETWGWDFPLTAMAATRLGLPEKAVDALLMPIQTNTYLVNGHNYQDGRLTIYLPGNGGLLSALAMMCAGYDGSNAINPGFPKDGTWKVRSEGLRKIF